MSGNPGRAKRAGRRVEKAAERDLFARLGDWIRGKKGQANYYHWRHRRKRRK